MLNGKIVSGKTMSKKLGGDTDLLKSTKSGNMVSATYDKDGYRYASGGNLANKQDAKDLSIDFNKNDPDFDYDHTDVYKKHLGGLFYSKQNMNEAYSEVLEFFVENGIYLNEDQLAALKEGIVRDLQNNHDQRVANNAAQKQMKAAQNYNYSISNQVNNFKNNVAQDKAARMQDKANLAQAKAQYAQAKADAKVNNNNRMQKYSLSSQIADRKMNKAYDKQQLAQNRINNRNVDAAVNASNNRGIKDIKQGNAEFAGTQTVGESYSDILEFFVQQGIQLSPDQIEELQEMNFTSDSMTTKTDRVGGRQQPMTPKDRLMRSAPQSKVQQMDPMQKTRALSNAEKYAAKTGVNLAKNIY